MVKRALSDGERPGHALIIGPKRSGRTSTIRAAARSAETETDRLVVELRLALDDLTPGGIQRAVLTATAERLIEGHDERPAWYLAWCDRVLLRDASPMAPRDALVSALTLAADSASTIDSAVFERDLRTLARLAGDRGYAGILLVIDDADELLEDFVLSERLVAALDAAREWSLLMASQHAGHDQLFEAVSSCLRQVTAVPLFPLWASDQIRVALTEPLGAEEGDALLPEAREQYFALLRDVANLTGGSPFEIALVGHQLWKACKLGEQEYFEVTPRVLERLVCDLSYFTGVDESVESGAAAARELPPEKLRSALELVALASLTTREIAIARALGLPQPGERPDERLLSCDLVTAEQRVLAELLELEEAGVVEVMADRSSFRLIGGRVAALTLRHEARAQLGPEATETSFGLPFAARVGEPLAADLARRARERLTDAHVHADLALHSGASPGTGARMRSALNANNISSLDVALEPTSADELDAVGAQLADGSDRAVVLVNLTLGAGREDLDWLELWDIAPGIEDHQVLQALSDELHTWQPLVETAGLTWRGSRVAVLEGSPARRALMSLVPYSARSGVRQLFTRWCADRDDELLARASALAGEALTALQDQAVPEWGRGFETSRLLSTLGFVQSLGDEDLADARGALEQAIARGPADGWVTTWNLGNVTARQGEFDAARRHLQSIRPRLEEQRNPAAWVSFFVPGRPAATSQVTVNGQNVLPLYDLQLALFEVAAGGEVGEVVIAALRACANSSDESSRAAAEWTAPALDLLRRELPTRSTS